MPKIQILLFTLTGIAFTSVGQQICGTPKQEQRRREKNPNMESLKVFEKWVREEKNRQRSTHRIQEVTYIVPVVFHVIHNGEPIGEGANISEARIRKELAKLNDDFQRKNADTTDTPVYFRPLAGKMNIKFVLAKQDPKGIPTNGILRVNGGEEEWDFHQEEVLKSKSYWPSKDYFNVWIANIIDSSLGEDKVLLGYAQFPESNLVSGLLPAFFADEKTDGVVLLPDLVASDQRAFDTFTHEVGHFLGLRHIWGDVKGCNNSGDYVDDTPPQDDYTVRCPDFALRECENKHIIMFHNYMDYSPCTDLFTRGQVERMKIILENSPRRKSLLSSRGSIKPTFVENDIKLEALLNPKKKSCGTAIVPRLQIANWGINTASSTRIEMRVNGKVIETRRAFAFSPALKQFEYDTLSFAPFDLSTQGTYKFRFKVLQVNQVGDEKPKNDTLSYTIHVPKQVGMPFFETFANGIADWDVVNSDRLITWENIDTDDNGATNKSAYIDFYNYKKTDIADQLISPSIRLSELDNTRIQDAQLQFDWFYAAQFDQPDRLQVLLATGCNNNIEDGELLFDKSGKALTTFSLSDANTSLPSASSQWKTTIIPIKKSIENLMERNGGSMDNIQIMFAATSGYGYKLYVDNISLSYPSDTNVPYVIYNQKDFKNIGIAFNLDHPETVKVSIYNLLGQLLSESTLKNAWKQQYTITTGMQQSGVCLLRVSLKEGTKTTRLFINP